MGVFLILSEGFTKESCEFGCYIGGSVVTSGGNRCLLTDILMCLFLLLELYWENDRQLFSRPIQLTSNYSAQKGRIFQFLKLIPFPTPSLHRTVLKCRYFRQNVDFGVV